MRGEVGKLGKLSIFVFGVLVGLQFSELQWSATAQPDHRRSLHTATTTTDDAARPLTKLAIEHKSSSGEAVLFGFDRHAFPFTLACRPHLISHKTGCGHTETVLSRGSAGAPDERAVVYYGSVVRVGAELRMYYIGLDHATNNGRLCFANSTDGVHWTKPHLHLAHYNGSRANNLIGLNWERAVYAALVLYTETASENKQTSTLEHHPFKMLFKTVSPGGRSQIYSALSADGLSWRVVGALSFSFPVDMSGLMFHSSSRRYIMSAHAGSEFGSRKMHVFVSYDFFHSWSEANSVAFTRSGTNPERYDPERGNAGEQVHQGAALWNRGNVVLGVYGQWHGDASNDRRKVAIDLGLLVSRDGLHFTEPLEGFRFVAAAEDGWAKPPASIPPQTAALMQGQGFENVGGQTLFWYSPWPEHVATGIRVGRWERDRLGYLQGRALFTGSESGTAGRHAHAISAVIEAVGETSGGTRVDVHANVRFKSRHGELLLELLTPEMQLVRMFSGAHAARILPKDAGLRTIVRWPYTSGSKGGGIPIGIVGSSFRVKASFAGIRPEDVELYALYVDSDGDSRPAHLRVLDG